MGIADHGTFSNAADALGTVQSNISNRIARLESELGTPLVNRATGNLTESGVIVVERARRILSELRAIASDVSELNAEIRGQVNLDDPGRQQLDCALASRKRARAIFTHQPAHQ